MSISVVDAGISTFFPFSDLGVIVLSGNRDALAIALKEVQVSEKLVMGE